MEIQLFPPSTGFSYIKTTENFIPSNMFDVVVFDNENLPTLNNTIDTECIIQTDYDNVEIVGKNVKFTEKYVSYIDNDGNNIIQYNPKSVMVKSYNKIVSKQISFIIGKISDIYWTPKYIAVTDNNHSIISLSLMANITNNTSRNYSLSKLIFNIKNLNIDMGINYSTHNYQKMALSSQSPRSYTEELPISQDVSSSKEYTYIVEGNFYLDKSIQLNLWNVDLHSEQIGYFFVNDNKVYYGYNLKTEPNSIIPSGMCILLTADHQVFEEFKFPEPVYDNIRLLLNPIREVTVVSDTVIDIDSKYRKIKLDYTFYNVLGHDLEILIIYKLVQGEVIKSITVNADQLAPTEDKFRHELSWKVHLKNETDTKFSTNFIIEL